MMTLMFKSSKNSNFQIKELIFLMGFSLVCNLSLGAQTLTGCYCEDFDYEAEHNSKYRFDINGHFDYQFWDDVEEIFASGSYFLRNDSLILNYKSMPNEAKAVRITSEVNQEDVSTFFVVSPVGSMPPWKCSYQIFESDSLISSGEGDQYGCFVTRLEVGQTIKVRAYLTNIFERHLGPIQFEVKGKNTQKDYVVKATGIRKTARIISSHSIGIPIHLKKRGLRFGLKVNNVWIWYKICNK